MSVSVSLSPTVRAAAKELGIGVRRIGRISRELYTVDTVQLTFCGADRFELTPAELSAFVAAAAEYATPERIAEARAAGISDGAVSTEFPRHGAYRSESCALYDIARPLSASRWGKTQIERAAEMGRAHAAALLCDIYLGVRA